MTSMTMFTQNQNPSYNFVSDPQLRGARGRSPPGSNVAPPPKVFWIVIISLYLLYFDCPPKARLLPPL